MATVRRRATRAVHLKFGGALRAQRVGVGGRGPARYARILLLCHRGGAAVRDVFSFEEVTPSFISPLVTGTEPVDPSTYVTFFRPFGRRRWSRGVHDEDTASCASATWLAPGCRPHTVARPRNCGSWCSLSTRHVPLSSLKTLASLSYLPIYVLSTGPPKKLPRYYLVHPE